MRAFAPRATTWSPHGHHSLIGPVRDLIAADESRIIRALTPSSATIGRATGAGLIAEGRPAAYVGGIMALANNPLDTTPRLVEPLATTGRCWGPASRPHNIADVWGRSA